MKSNLGHSRDEISESEKVLLLAAKADKDFGDHLRVVLRLPSHRRKSMINTALAEMQRKGEPPLLMQAIALLADEASAARMLGYLEK